VYYYTTNSIFVVLLVMQRRVIVPPELGYGKRGMSEIPVLCFDLPKFHWSVRLVTG
jgi:hypothetical protein